MTRVTPFGTPATRLHVGRIVLTALGVGALIVAGLAWMFASHRPTKAPDLTEAGATGWTPTQHYALPEVKVVEASPPVDDSAAKWAALMAKLAQMQAELDALKNRKTTTTIVQPSVPKQAAVKPPPGSMLFVEHQVQEAAGLPKANEYVLAPGATKIPCIVETKINSDVPGFFTCKVSTNVWDTASGRHLLVPQGSTILAHDNSQKLIYGSERLDTVSLTLALPDGRSVDLGKAPVTDQEGAAGLTGEVDSHFWRILGAVFIGGALKGGITAFQIAAADAAGAGQVAAGFTGLANQATTTAIQPYINIRPTIRVFAGQLANVLLVRELKLPAMWE